MVQNGRMASDEPAERGRDRVLAALRDADSALDAREVGERVGLHVNTARFHLDELVTRGLAEQSREQRTTPGRPRTLYSATPDPTVAADRYRALAGVLGAALQELAPDPSAAAERAGEAWGRALAAAGSVDLDPDAAIARVIEVLRDEGFRAEAASAAGALTGRAPEDAGVLDDLVITRCPFLDVASANPDVVCAVHEGMMNGVLARTRAPLRVHQLLPLVSPGRCEVRWRRV